MNVMVMNPSNYVLWPYDFLPSPQGIKNWHMDGRPAAAKILQKKLFVDVSGRELETSNSTYKLFASLT